MEITKDKTSTTLTRREKYPHTSQDFLSGGSSHRYKRKKCKENKFFLQIGDFFLLLCKNISKKHNKKT